MRIVAPTYTQCPNDLIDHWLPHLKEVELKVLLVIIRQTFGYHKRRDRISLSQLMKKTGAQRTSIIEATQCLQDKGLILKETVGPNGKQETYYELVVEEENSNKSDQCGINTPPSAESAPPPVRNSHPQKKEPPNGGINKKKERSDDDVDKPSSSSENSFFLSSSIDETESENAKKRELLKDLSLPEVSIQTFLSLKSTLQEFKDALEAAMEYKPDDLAPCITKAIKGKWKPNGQKTTPSELIASNREYAQRLWDMGYQVFSKNTNYVVEKLNHGILISTAGAASQTMMLHYDNPKFKVRLTNATKRIGLPNKYVPVSFSNITDELQEKA